MPLPEFADRNLLVALVAFQVGFLERGTFLEVMRQWIADRSSSMEDILRKHGRLSDETVRLVVALAAKHVEFSGGDTVRSIGSLSSISDVKTELAALGDEQIARTLTLLPRTDRAAATATYSGRVAPHFGAGPPAVGQRFKVLRFHKRGGLGEVSVARDEELNREVALKEIQSEYVDDAVSRQRFVMEAEITGALEHPNIVPIYSLGAYQDGRPYYAMRFIHGDNLGEAIAAFHARQDSSWGPGERLFEMRRLLGRFIDVCDAVAYAHSRGVLHRDLKPGNIMLGKFGETLVVDWGLAKSSGRHDPPGTDEPVVTSRSGDLTQTMAGKPIGTPGFMSPEQAAGQLDQLGPATDVYSLGATLYCILAGRAPLAGDELKAFQRRVAAGDIKPPSNWKADVPEPLEAICLKALATRFGDRYGHARDLADDLERWLADEPVTAYQEPPLARLARLGRRHRTFVTGCVVLLVATAIGLSVFGAMMSTKNRELTHAWKTARKQERLAVNERNRAQSNLDVARQWSLDLLALAEGLARSPAQGDVRRKLTADTLTALQKLYVSQPEDIELKYALARALHTWANFSLADDLDAAIKANQDAVALLESQPNSPGNVPRSLAPRERDLLGELLRDQGSLWRRKGDGVQAGRAFERSNEYVQALRQEFPEQLDYVRSEASLYTSWSSHLVQEGEIDTALERITAAVALLRHVVNHADVRPRDKLVLALAMQTRAEVLRVAQRDGELESFVAEAIPYCDSLDQSDMNVRYVGARLRYQLMRAVAGQESRRVEALKIADDVVDRYRQIISDAKGSNRIATYRLNLARTLTQRSVLRMTLEQYEPARADVDEALGLLQPNGAAPNATVQDKDALAQALWQAARLAAQRGDKDGARRDLAAAIKLQREFVEQNPNEREAVRHLRSMEKDGQ